LPASPSPLPAPTPAPAIAELLQQAIDQERGRIAGLLHDDLGGTLLGLQMGLARLHAKVRAADAATVAPREPHELLEPRWLQEQLAYLQTLASDCLASSARLCHDLQPPQLAPGLLPALETLCQQFARQAGLDCDFICQLDQANLPPQAQSNAPALFLICREALNNVGKHAHASHASITLFCDGDTLHLKISDNGVGMPTPLVAGRGCPGMQARASAMGASLTLEQGKPGTCWHLRLPLPDSTIDTH
jgi:signal transduction histidine kinase